MIAFLFIYNFFYAIAYTPLNPAYVVEVSHEQLKQSSQESVNSNTFTRYTPLSSEAAA